MGTPPRTLSVPSRSKTGSAELIQQLLPRFKIEDIEVRRPAVEETIRRIYEERLLLPGG